MDERNVQDEEKRKHRIGHLREGYNGKWPKSKILDFAGENPVRWLMNCELYLDRCEVTYVYKTRLAVMYF